MHDARAELASDVVNGVDVLTAPGAEAHVVQTATPLRERRVPELRRRRSEPDGRLASDEVEVVVQVHDLGEAHERQQPLVERFRSGQVAHRQHHVGNSTDFHGFLPGGRESLAPLRQGYAGETESTTRAIAAAAMMVTR